MHNTRSLYDPSRSGCASHVSFNLKAQAALLHSWSPTEAITPGPLSPFTERGRALRVEEGGEEEQEGGRGGGGRREGDEKRVITQTTLFYPFHPLWIGAVR